MSNMNAYQGAFETRSEVETTAHDQQRRFFEECLGVVANLLITVKHFLHQFW